MGVRLVDPRKEEPAFKLATEMKCCNTKCPNTIIPLELVHEDEEQIQYSGFCSSCGIEYYLSHDKDLES